MVIDFFARRRTVGATGDVHLPVLASLAEVRGYWEALRGGQGLPRRDQLDPRGMAGALGGAFLIERMAPGHARFRLAGSELHDLMGMEVRGMPFSTLFDPAARAQLSPALEAVFSTPAILTLRLEAERGIGKPGLSAQMLILPLSEEGDRRDLALGVLCCEGRVGRSPRRFAIGSLMREAVPSAEPRPRPAPLREPKRPAVSGRPHLVLVSSN